MSKKNLIVNLIIQKNFEGTRENILHIYQALGLTGYDSWKPIKLTYIRKVTTYIGWTLLTAPCMHD